jgi:hypothetical protein
VTLKPLLLMLNGVDAQVVFDALTILADVCELEGDPCNVAPVADDVCERIRKLQNVDDEATRQALLALGLGVGRGRPQG